MRRPLLLASTLFTVFVVVFVSAVVPASAAGQTPGTCGWSYLDDEVRPPLLEKLVARQPLAPELQPSVARLEQWYRDCDATAANVAAFDLRRIRSRTNSSDPQLRALLGIAELRGPDVQVPRAEGALLRPAFEETNAATDGVRLLSAVARETGWTEVAEELGLVALAINKPSHMKTAVGVLEHRHFAAEPRLQALLAELHLRLGDTRRAAETARRAAASGNVLGRRAVAVVAAQRGERSDDYLAALADADPATELQPFFDDLRLLLDPEEAAEWRTLDPVQRAGWIRRKWEWRAMLAGIDVEQRIAEHHRRMSVALKDYQRRGFRGSPPMNAAWLERTEFMRQPLDDRGLILLRHGEPWREVLLRGAASMKPDSPGHVLAWYFPNKPGGPGVFEFATINDRSDWFLIEPSPVCKGGHVLDNQPQAAGLRQQSTMGYTRTRDTGAWAAMIAPLDPMLALYYSQCDNGSFNAVAQYVAQRTETRIEAQQAMVTESAVPRGRRTLATFLNLYGFRGANGGEVVAYLGVQGDSLASRTVPGGQEYALVVRMAGGTPTGGIFAERDSVLRFMQPGPLPAGATVGAAIALPLPAGTASRVVVSVVNAHDTAQAQVMSSTRRVPPSAGAMTMSDIVVAHDRDGAWMRRGMRLAPVLGHAVASGDAVRVYYEMYNVPADAPLQVDIEITPSRDPSILSALRELVSRRTAVTVRFSETADPAADGTLAVLRTVTADLEPGSYTLSVRVTNLASEVTESHETNLVVLPG